MNRILILGMLLGLLAAQARALVSMDPKLASELKRRGVYESVAQQLRDARARGVFREDHIRPPGDGSGKRVKTWRALVILVDFPDFAATGNYNQAEFDDLLFSEGTHPFGSMRDFYLENSYGDYSIIGDVVGWYTMPENYSYYCNNDGVPSADDFGFGAYPNNAERLYEDAIAAADPDVNFQLYTNGGGSVDGVFIVHAGPGAEASGNPSHIWSHRSSFNANTSDGVICTSYTFQPETYGAGISTMGVFGHEFAHTLGLPDLYDTDYTSRGIGRWSMMAGGSWNNGGRTPAHFDAWCKEELGFTVAIEITLPTIGVVLPPAHANEHAIKLKTPGHAGAEYMLIENRQKNGFDASLPGSGLLVWHVDGSQQTNSFESCGANPSHPIVRLIQADDLCELENDIDSGDTGDPFPGSSNNTQLDALTSPDSRAYSGKNSGILLENIAVVGSDVQLDIDPNHSLVMQVPSQFANLNSALDLAGYSDEVRLRFDHVVSGNHVIAAPVRVSGGWDASYTTQDLQAKTLVQGTGSLQPLMRIVTQGTGTPELSNLRFVAGGGQEVFDPDQAWEGGAVRMQGGSLTISDCEFENNSAGFNDGLASRGGAIALAGVTATISNSSFLDNHAKSGADLHLTGGVATVVDCDFQGGTLYVPGVATEQRGGSVHVVGGQEAHFTNCQFGPYGGADRGGAIYASASLLTLDGTQLSGSNAEQEGGGIYLENATLDWTASELGLCTSGALGAGIYASASLVRIDGGRVYGNSSSSLGAGLYLIDSLPGSRLRSLLLDSNQSSIIGGGLIVSGGEMLVEHCVFHANSSLLGSAGAAQIVNSTIEFRHNLVHDSVGGGVLWSGGGTHAHNGYWGTSPGVDLSGIAMDLDSLSEDPLFVDDATGDFHLGAGSPMIDAGSALAPADFDGSLPDLGLYGGTMDDGDRPAAPLAFEVQAQIDQVDLSWQFPGAGTVVAFTRVFGDYVASLPKAGMGNGLMLIDVAAPTTNWSDDSGRGAFQIQLVDANGRAGAYSALAYAENPDAAPEIPDRFVLGAATPNPFNPSTRIELSLPQRGRVRALIFDSRGRRVRALAERFFEAGRHWLHWDGRDDGGAPLASGRYLLRIQSEQGDATRHLTLLK